MHKGPYFYPKHHSKKDVVANASNPRTREVEHEE